MWQYNPQNPHKPIWNHEPEPNLNFTASPGPESTTVSPAKDIGNMLNDVERALNYVKTTLGDLDRALSGVERRLINMEESLNSKQPITSQEDFESKLKAFLSEAQAAVEREYAVEEKQKQGLLYNPEIKPEFLDDGPATGDTLQWYREQGDQVLGEVLDANALSHGPTTYIAAEGGLEKDSDSDFVGYAADGEDSPPFGKKFET